MSVQIKVKTNSLPGSRLSVQLEIPTERCKASYEEALSSLSRSANLPGFRKGKVPKAVILQQVGVERIKASALEKLLQKVWVEAIEQESIEPLCEPELKDEFDSLLANFDLNKNLILNLETDISPTPILKETKGLTAEVEKIEFDPTKVDELIEQSRKQLATIVPVEKRGAEMGDIAVVSFQGNYKDDGTEIEGGSAESMDLELENGRMIPGFIEGIIGMKINEKKSLDCEFPIDYHQEESKGRKAIFIVNLKDLKTRELPELNDAFAKQASDKNNMIELKEDLEERLKEEAKRNQTKIRQESLLKALVNELEVDIPNTLIEQEVRNIVENTAQNFAQQGIDVKSVFTPELVQSLMKSSRKEAEENVRRQLALNALAKAENIEVVEKDLQTKLKEVKNELGDERKIDEERLKQAVSDDLLQEKLLQWLEENNIVKEIKNKKNKANSKSKKSPDTGSSKKAPKTKPNTKNTTKASDKV